MTQIRAFVGHSFLPDDEEVVAKFLSYFDQVEGVLPNFQWEHAKAAEPTELAAKVLKVIEGKNTFIGICTKRERTVADNKLRPGFFNRRIKTVTESDLDWKTSDWLIQEIGLAVGRGMTIILLVEDGCRKPGGLQGDVEFLTFQRHAPERIFGRLLEMMKALSPRRAGGEAASPESPPDSADDGVEPTAPEEDDSPQPTWDRAKYDNALLWKLISHDKDGAAKIEDAFKSSHLATSEEVVAAWTASAEAWRIVTGEQGSLSRLKDCQEKLPQNAEIATHLAIALASLGMHEAAAAQYLSASNLVSSDQVERERLRGRAAVQLVKAGSKEKAELLLREQRKSLRSSDPQQEINYLSRLKEVATEAGDQYAEIEVLERTIQLSPDDWDARFRLGYAYSQLNINDMSLYHYAQIPHGERSAITWNNLGVAYQQFAMPAKAVDAYRTASENGETLAMSNLAYKLMEAGFLKEANHELQRAIKMEDFHRNVGQAISALKDIPEAETKKLKESIATVEPKRRFFRDLAEAATLADIEALPQGWVGPDCDLSISITNDELRAVGEYDRKVGGLGMAFASVSRTAHYKLSFTGKLRGHRVVGTFTRKSDDEKLNAGALALLGEGSDDVEFAMVISPAEGSITVAERQSSTNPRFYTIKAIEAQTQRLLPSGT